MALVPNVGLVKTKPTLGTSHVERRDCDWVRIE